MTHYILCWRATRFWFVGPFLNANSAVRWAQDPINNPADNPCWQHIELPGKTPAQPPEILTPTAATNRAAADADHNA